MSLQDLTQGCIDTMLEGDASAPTVQDPVLQVLSVKKIQSTAANAADRWRVILSDGTHFAQGMLSTQLKHLVDDDLLKRNCIIKLTQYAANTVSNRRILILLALDIVTPATDASERLGEPTNWQDQQTKKQEAAAAAPPVAAKKEPAAPKPAPARAQASTTRVNKPSNNSNSPIYPIEGLSPYQNKWTIKARVTSRSEIKHWSNARGEGKLFSVNLLDESGEIKATGFNDVVDKYHPILQENKVFLISKGKVGIAKKQFSTLKNEYEITFERDTEIEECEDDDAKIPEIKYDFVPFDQLENVEANQTCDVLAIVDQIGEVGEIIGKASQKPVSKRELTLVDQTGRSCRLTLWGKTAETYGTEQGVNGGVGTGPGDKPVLALKGVKVGDYGGRSLSMFSSTTMVVDPDLPEAHGLRGWYDDEGKQGNFKPFTSTGGGGVGADAGGNANERRTIAQVKDEGLGMHPEKMDYFNTRATVVFVRPDNLFYAACPSDTCNKKVTMEGDGKWRCEKCDRTYPEPQYRYILAANTQDATGQMWISGFNDIGELLLGTTASELARIKDDDNALYQQTLTDAANNMFMFNCRAKQDTFNDQTRVRYTVTKAAKVDWGKVGQELAESIKKLM